MDWTDDLISFVASSPRIAKHTHVPLQSASDAVLRRMHRKYRPWHYREKIEKIRAAMPTAAIGADVMVGFPGETEAEFAETVALIRALPFGYLHLFPFSPRPGTRGWTLHAESPVVPQAVDERMSALRFLAAEKSSAHRAHFIGRELEAITLHTPLALAQLNRTSALTENFLPVEIEGRLPANRLLRVRISGLTSDGALQASEALHAVPSPALAIQ